MKLNSYYICDKDGYIKEWKKQPPVYRKQTKAQIKAGAKKSVLIPASWYISYTPIEKEYDFSIDCVDMGIELATG